MRRWRAPLSASCSPSSILATAGAFLASQYLKGEEPLVLRFEREPQAFSPTAHGVRDHAGSASCCASRPR